MQAHLVYKWRDPVALAYACLGLGCSLLLGLMVCLQMLRTSRLASTSGMRAGSVPRVCQKGLALQSFFMLYPVLFPLKGSLVAELVSTLLFTLSAFTYFHIWAIISFHTLEAVNKVTHSIKHPQLRRLRWHLQLPFYVCVLVTVCVEAVRFVCKLNWPRLITVLTQVLYLLVVLLFLYISTLQLYRQLTKLDSSFAGSEARYGRTIRRFKIALTVVTVGAVLCLLGLATQTVSLVQDLDASAYTLENLSAEGGVPPLNWYVYSLYIGAAIITGWYGWVRRDGRQMGPTGARISVGSLPHSRVSNTFVRKSLPDLAVGPSLDDLSRQASDLSATARLEVCSVQGHRISLGAPITPRGTTIRATLTPRSTSPRQLQVPTELSSPSQAQGTAGSPTANSEKGRVRKRDSRASASLQPMLRMGDYEDDEEDEITEVQAPPSAERTMQTARGRQQEEDGAIISLTERKTVDADGKRAYASSNSSRDGAAELHSDMIEALSQPHLPSANEAVRNASAPARMACVNKEHNTTPIEFSPDVSRCKSDPELSPTDLVCSTIDLHGTFFLRAVSVSPDRMLTLPFAPLGPGSPSPLPTLPSPSPLSNLNLDRHPSHSPLPELAADRRRSFSPGLCSVQSSSTLPLTSPIRRHSSSALPVTSPTRSVRSTLPVTSPVRGQSSSSIPVASHTRGGSVQLTVAVTSPVRGQSTSTLPVTSPTRGGSIQSTLQVTSPTRGNALEPLDESALTRQASSSSCEVNETPKCVVASSRASTPSPLRLPKRSPSGQRWIVHVVPAIVRPDETAVDREFDRLHIAVSQPSPVSPAHRLDRSRSSPLSPKSPHFPAADCDRLHIASQPAQNSQPSEGHEPVSAVGGPKGSGSYQAKIAKKASRPESEPFSPTRDRLPFASRPQSENSSPRRGRLQRASRPQSQNSSPTRDRLQRASRPESEPFSPTRDRLPFGRCLDPCDELSPSPYSPLARGHDRSRSEHFDRQHLVAIQPSAFPPSPRGPDIAIQPSSTVTPARRVGRPRSSPLSPKSPHFPDRSRSSPLSPKSPHFPTAFSPARFLDRPRSQPLSLDSPHHLSLDHVPFRMLNRTEHNAESAPTLDSGLGDKETKPAFLPRVVAARSHRRSMLLQHRRVHSLPAAGHLGSASTRSLDSAFPTTRITSTSPVSDRSKASSPDAMDGHALLDWREESLQQLSPVWFSSGKENQENECRQ